MRLTKLNPGDTVALISPSAGLPGAFPWVHELGVQRIEQEFNLKTIEYPTTRTMNSSLEDRARDVMAAFTDPEVKAIIATIGGDDQIQLIEHLDQDLIKRNSKLFFGYSDNTHLHNMLWNLGIPSFYGGCVMTQFGMNAAMDEMTKESLKEALFESNEVELSPSKVFTGIGLDWKDKDSLQTPRTMEKNNGWVWDGNSDAEGTLWGGCVESLVTQVAADTYLPSDKDIDGAVLILETSEEIPEHKIIEDLLVNFGERDWFTRFTAVLVGRPKTWEFDKQNDPATRAKYTQDQQATVLKTIRKYSETIPVIQNLDFGHTDPQTIMPLGKNVAINNDDRTITVSY